MDSGLDPTPYVEIKPHPKSRKLKLSFRPKRGFLLSHPPRTSKRAIHKFLESQREWMQRVMVHAESHPPLPSLREYLEQNPVLTLNGIEKTVRFTPTRGLLSESDSEIFIFPEISESQLLRKLQQLAKEHLSDHLESLSLQVNQSIGKVQIRDQRSRWGSCSGRKNISLNWRLILMPPELQRHIMLHELAHIPHPDHSERFWHCLKQWDPNTPFHKEQLRLSGKIWIELGR